MATLRGPLQITYYEMVINYELLKYNIDQDASIGALGEKNPLRKHINLGNLKLRGGPATLNSEVCFPPGRLSTRLSILSTVVPLFSPKSTQ